MRFIVRRTFVAVHPPVHFQSLVQDSAMHKPAGLRVISGQILITITRPEMKFSFDGCIGRTVSRKVAKIPHKTAIDSFHRASMTVGAAISLTVPLPMPRRR
jgi:hypothetical protein